MLTNIRKYTVQGIRETRFHELAFMVERSASSRRTDVIAVETPRVFTVTDQIEDIPSRHREKRESPQSNVVGTYFNLDGVIWVRPVSSVRDQEETMLHEIAHAFVRDQSHGSKWRRVFCVALAIWLRERGASELEVRNGMYDELSYYRKYRAWTPQGHFNQFSEYRSKLRAEIDRYMKASLKV